MSVPQGRGKPGSEELNNLAQVTELGAELEQGTVNLPYQGSQTVLPAPVVSAKPNERQGDAG